MRRSGRCCRMCVKRSFTHRQTTHGWGPAGRCHLTRGYAGERAVHRRLLRRACQGPRGPLGSARRVPDSDRLQASSRPCPRALVTVWPPRGLPGRMTKAGPGRTREEGMQREGGPTTWLGWSQGAPDGPSHSPHRAWSSSQLQDSRARDRGLAPAPPGLAVCRRPEPILAARSMAEETTGG